MYLAARITTLLSLLISLWGGSTIAVLAATVARPLTATSSLLPSYPSGDLKLFHFPGNVVGNVAFTPDGSAYSPVRDGLLRIAPDGTKSFVGTPSTYGGGSVSQRILYSNGFLWLEVHQGYLRIHPDGTDQRFLQFPRATGERQATNFTAGPDGIYYTYYPETETFPSGTFLEGPVLASVSNSFVKTVYPLVAPVVVNNGEYYGPSVASIVPAPDGNVYFEYNKLPGKPLSFGRVTPAGVVTLFPSTDPCGGAQQLVYAKGSFYFFSFAEASGSSIHGTNALCRVTKTGQYTTIATQPAGPYFAPKVGVAADNDGNLWTTQFFGPGLYSYNVATRAVSGPIDPSVVNVGGSYLFPSLYIGPDQNVYFFGSYASSQIYFGAYIRHQMSFTPSAVGLVFSDAAMNVYVSEPIPSGPWTAVSLNPAIATVTPASSPVGRFSVTEVGQGSTSIEVTDVYGNVQYVPVTAH